MCLNQAVHPLSMFGSISYKCTVCIQLVFIISMYTLIINNNMFFRKHRTNKLTCLNVLNIVIEYIDDYKL